MATARVGEGLPSSGSVPPDVDAAIPLNDGDPQSRHESEPRPATSYFANTHGFGGSISPSESVADAAKGVKTGAELLRRLSLAEPHKPETFNFNPTKVYPGLKLSGNIISASICLPYQFKHQAGGDWKLSPRKGTSALFDSFEYIASDKTPWNHTLVGWTGEITPVQEKYYTPSALSSANLARNQTQTTTPFQSSRRPLADGTKASAALPPPGMQAHVYNPATDTITVTKADRDRLDEQLQAECSGKMVPIWLSEDHEEGMVDLKLKDQGRWRRYAEHELYTLFHYRQHAPDDGRAEKVSWNDYLRMNQIFAEKIIQTYKPGDIIWIHDYHLMLLPNFLRQRIPNAYIGFFLHIPFPSSEYMRCLPRRKDVLSGPLGATMIGFQSYNFARHFNSCCKRILGFESSSAGVDAYGAHVAVDVFPIGIDVAAVQKAAFGDSAVQENMTALRQVYAGKKLIVGRDRLDTVRGVSQKLQAFEIFLDRYPEWRDKVVLIQVTSPTSVQEEKEDSGHKIESKISSLVSRINGEFGSLSHTPVQHYPQYLDTAQYFALLRLADVGLITSVRDGMNTTSLEYIICQKDHFGPLILSEFSGTASSLANAIHINPWDLGNVADTLNEALLKPKAEKKADHDKLYDYVTTHTVSTWTNNYLKRLLTNLTSFSQFDLTPVLDRKKLLSRYRNSSKRLFMFDYDGTLTPIVKDPNAAIPTDRVLRTLKALAEDPRNNVWIISGRDASFLEEWMGHISELGLSAEHGCFLRRPGSETWENLTESMDMSWQKEVFDVFSHYTERTPGSWIERKRVALTWHYRQVDPDFGSHQARECTKVLQDGVAKKWEVEVMSGKANLEVRPTFVNKGFIANRLVSEYGYQDGGEPPGFVLCLGDDTTDEHMFEALQNSKLPREHIFACTVGASSKRTKATYHVLEPADVIAAVSSLVKPRTQTINEHR
ncbi:trehalose-phosphatase [Cyphellophora europaea CBS 101466]|uniref:Trehalose-phosphatase n=1 Tax=Cyphellophora europaea (strain CBS 101466) TaxID=1220924 RepID=W2SBY1_CYPE1|nr:trehalose-phosphatase [Cyphellophora europaea CBS 101466]ETN45523.1 trehalose-phosphatase [Cyphellophora europaea CBS 101466]